MTVIPIKVVLAVPDFPTCEEAPKYIMVQAQSRPGTLPMGLFYIASYLEKHGMAVEIIDNFVLKLPSEEFVKRIVVANPSVVGFSVNSFTYPQGKQNMKELKALLPAVPIVAGGVHPTLFPEEVAKEPFVDFVVKGEGEKTFLELLQAIEKKARSFEDVKGLVFKKADGSIHVSAERPLMNLEELPWPARHLKNFTDYTRGKTNYMNVEPIDVIASSRGCPFNCAFCSSNVIWKRAYRHRPVKDVVDEIEYLIKNHGTKGLYFREDNFTVNREKVTELCEEIKRRGISLPWMCESRVDLIDEGILQVMKSAGCMGIWFGVESGSQRILDYVNKGIKLEDVERCIKLCKKYGVKTGASFIFGLPPETKEDVKLSFEFAKKLGCDTTWFNQFLGVPNSKIYLEIKEKKYYKYDWNGILAVETPNFTFEELGKMDVELNDYFKFTRWKTLLAVTKPSKMVRKLPQALRIVKNAVLTSII